MESARKIVVKSVGTSNTTDLNGFENATPGSIIASSASKILLNLWLF